MDNKSEMTMQDLRDWDEGKSLPRLVLRFDNGHMMSISVSGSVLRMLSLRL